MSEILLDTGSMSTRDEHGTGLDWSQFWPAQDWIGLRKFLLF